MHELRRFKGLKAKYLDGRSVRSASLAFSFQAGDIVVCLHSIIERIPKNYLAKFSSIVIDGRYPSGFASARPHSVAADEAFCAPNEFSSCDWWTKLALATSDGTVKCRLLIESSYHDRAPFYFWKHNVSEWRFY
jgi:hypothetical protein